MAEAFGKTFKRAYIRVNLIPDAATAFPARLLLTPRIY